MIDLIEKEEYKKRLKTCMQCKLFDQENYICIECGCNTLLKALYQETTCPLNKWPKESDKNERD
jgi:DNA-binding XRE family transcriptional regulator